MQVHFNVKGCIGDSNCVHKGKVVVNDRFYLYYVLLHHLARARIDTLLNMGCKKYFNENIHVKYFPLR